MIDARNVNVWIGRRQILSEVSFSAKPGEVTVIIGPNGSGKSTLVKALSGDLPYSGMISLNGRELAQLRPSEAATIRAVLPQATRLSFPYTVREVVQLGLLKGNSGNRSASSEGQHHMADHALEKVDLAGFAGRFYQELSGGEQQRVQLARVLCQVWAPMLEGTPRWLILDEPISSLDIRHQILVMRIARDFAARGGGVVAVLHDLNLTAAFADRVAVFRQGRAVAAGEAQDVMQDAMLSHVFECNLKVGAIPAGRVPFVLPQTVQD